MARGADNDSRQGICAIASSGEAIKHSFSPALVRGNQSEDCGRFIPSSGVGCAQEISTRVEYELACRFCAISTVAEAMENGFALSAARGREFRDGSVSVLILAAAKFCRAIDIAGTVENDARHWDFSIAATGKKMQQGFCPASGRLRHPKDRAAAVGAGLGRGFIEVSRCIQG